MDLVIDKVVVIVVHECIEPCVDVPKLSFQSGCFCFQASLKTIYGSIQCDGELINCPTHAAFLAAHAPQGCKNHKDRDD
ncbi:hypothetical protein JXM67_11405 [candidate division WOR-3 bacterium]|nr:hypothetical protein [candidate division WOR-3 bacterium]